MPKRPMSGFMLFVNEERESIKAKNPDIKVTEVGKIAGQMWKDMDADKKQVG